MGVIMVMIGLVRLRITWRGQAMAEHDALSLAVAKLPGHLGTDDGLVEPVEIARKGSALLPLQTLVVAIGHVLEIGRGGAQHRKAAVRVAQADRHRPGHGRVAGYRLQAAH
ncbi:MAG: hypothetical protein ACKOFG_12875, partial [Limnohabitans sp.]